VGRPPSVEEAAYCAAAAGLPVPNTMTFAPIGVRTLKLGGLLLRLCCGFRRHETIAGVAILAELLPLMHPLDGDHPLKGIGGGR
jgi:hypothetical protein